MSPASGSPGRISRRSATTFQVVSEIACTWHACFVPKPTCLLLDEPTNDLDVNIMRALEEAIQNFAGCAVVISHDRWFLDRIATHILAFEGDSNVSSGSMATGVHTKKTDANESETTPINQDQSNIESLPEVESSQGDLRV